MTDLNIKHIGYTNTEDYNTQRDNERVRVM